MNEKILSLKGKAALITGAAGAIGYAVAQALLENGCRGSRQGNGC